MVFNLSWVFYLIYAVGWIGFVGPEDIWIEAIMCGLNPRVQSIDIAILHL